MSKHLETRIIVANPIRRFSRTARVWTQTGAEAPITNSTTSKEGSAYQYTQPEIRQALVTPRRKEAPYSI